LEVKYLAEKIRLVHRKRMAKRFLDFAGGSGRNDAL
jgi:hypothetical protein